MESPHGAPASIIRISSRIRGSAGFIRSTNKRLAPPPPRDNKRHLASSRTVIKFSCFLGPKFSDRCGLLSAVTGEQREIAAAEVAPDPAIALARFGLRPAKADRMRRVEIVALKPNSGPTWPSSYTGLELHSIFFSASGHLTSPKNKIRRSPTNFFGVERSSDLGFRANTANIAPGPLSPQRLCDERRRRCTESAPTGENASWASWSAA